MPAEFTGIRSGYLKRYLDVLSLEPEGMEAIGKQIDEMVKLDFHMTPEEIEYAKRLLDPEGRFL